MRNIKRLFWDIETSPNIAFTWRAGYKLTIPHDNILRERAIICICYKWEGEKKVHYLQWDNGDDKKMLEKFVQIANEADELVAHNGDKFDLKWFNTRCLYHGLDPNPIHKTIDTLSIARSRFYFNSNKLDYIASFLGLGGKMDTGGFDLWARITLNNDPQAMKKMVQYCKRDVVLLEKVWYKLEKYHRPKSHAGVYAGLEKWTCPHDGSHNVAKSKTRITTAGTIQHQMRCNDCGSYYTIPINVFKKYQEEKGL